MKSVLSAVKETCKNGHVLWVAVDVSEGTDIYEQDEDCTEVIFRNAALSKRPERTVTVSCNHGCEMSREAEANMKYMLKNSEPRT